MRYFDIAVIGAGPAGLAASILAAKAGAKVVLIDENAKPGGQLFKQIHKFFGSRAHYAGMRGMDIGNQLLSEAESSGVEVLLNSTVWGMFGKQLAIMRHQRTETIQAEKIILATGAQENPLRFSGWTLPGVMTAGAAQTMVNIHRVLPGKRVLMVGSGNVGLIVSYQLLQAGAKVIALVEAAPEVGGYFVHAAKIARAGVPILVSHTIKEAMGQGKVEAATIVALDGGWNPISGSEKKLDVDSILLAVGLTPQSALAWMAGCKMSYSPVLSGHIPTTDQNMETSIDGVYVAGDVASVEEASIAMEEGKVAGISAIQSLGLITPTEASDLKKESWERLNELRLGASEDKQMAYRRKGYITKTELDHLKLTPPKDRIKKGPVAILECPQLIPCNPCENACPKGAITVGTPITNIPFLDWEKCIGCGTCIHQCPGLAIFVVDGANGIVGIPYELLPLPKVGEELLCLDRAGRVRCQGQVIRVINKKNQNRTAVIYLKVPKNLVMKIRNIRKVGSSDAGYKQ